MVFRGKLLGSVWDNSYLHFLTIWVYTGNPVSIAVAILSQSLSHPLSNEVTIHIASLIGSSRRTKLHPAKGFWTLGLISSCPHIPHNLGDQKKFHYQPWRFKVSISSHRKWKSLNQPKPRLISGFGWWFILPLVIDDGLYLTNKLNQLSSTDLTQLMDIQRWCPWSTMADTWSRSRRRFAVTKQSGGWCTTRWLRPHPFSMAIKKITTMINR